MLFPFPPRSLPHWHTPRPHPFILVLSPIYTHIIKTINNHQGVFSSSDSSLQWTGIHEVNRKF